MPNVLGMVHLSIDTTQYIEYNVFNNVVPLKKEVFAMKKLLLWTLLLCMVFPVALGEDLGVRTGGDAVIVEETEESSVCDIDNLIVDKTAYVDTRYEVSVAYFEREDAFLEQVQGHDPANFSNTFWYNEKQNSYASQTRSYHNVAWTYPDGNTVYFSDVQLVRHDSGSQADFICLGLAILNKSSAYIDLTQTATVNVIFRGGTATGEPIEYTGWIRQCDPDKSLQYPVNPADNFAVGPYFTGYYLFGCTLPNAILENAGPLRMEVTIGDIVLTYHIRK